jgi:hypothetical protein
VLGILFKSFFNRKYLKNKFLKIIIFNQNIKTIKKL